MLYLIIWAALTILNYLMMRHVVKRDMQQGYVDTTAIGLVFFVMAIPFFGTIIFASFLVHHYIEDMSKEELMRKIFLIKKSKEGNK